MTPEMAITSVDDLDQSLERLSLQIDALLRERADLLQTLRYIVQLSAGWDADGSVGPRPPLSWETVARMSMDIARGTLQEVEAKS
jgi:hypothetical protein